VGNPPGSWNLRFGAGRWLRIWRNLMAKYDQDQSKRKEKWYNAVKRKKRSCNLRVSCSDGYLALREKLNLLEQAASQVEPRGGWNKRMDARMKNQEDGNHVVLEISGIA
jgi:hypothetical protein